MKEIITGIFAAIGIIIATIIGLLIMFLVVIAFPFVWAWNNFNY